MRVTTMQNFQGISQDVQKIQQEMGNYQQQIASGKKIQRASESPVDAKQIEASEQALKRVEQYQENAYDAKMLLETKSTALEDVFSLIDRSRIEGLKAGSDTYNEDDLNTFAGVVDNMLEQLVEVGNTQHLDRYIFSGEKTGTEPFAYDGDEVVYQGNNEEVSIQISPYIDTKVHEGGDKVLTDSMNHLIELRDNLRDGDRDAVENDLGNLKADMDGALDYVAEVGVRIDGLNNMEDSFEQQKLSLQERKSNAEDVDYAEAISEFSMAQTAYEGTLAASTMMMNTSMLDYI